MKRLAFVLVLLPALSWAQKPTVIISGDGAATVVSVGTQGPAGANIPAGGSEGQGACKSGAGFGWCSTFLCTGGNCSFTVPILAGDGTGIGFAGEPTTKFWRNLAGAIDVDFSGISGMRFQSGVLRLLTAGGTIYAGAASDAQIGRDATSTWQLGPDTIAATAQTLKGPDSTGAGNAGGDLNLVGGSPGAGGTQGNVVIGAGSTGSRLNGSVLSPAADNCTAPPFSFAGDTTTGLCSSAAGTVVLRVAGANNLYLTANTLALRNGANPQTLEINNTYTDSGNYERASLAWSANIFRLGLQKAGTGQSRQMILDGAAGSTIELYFGGVGAWRFNSTSFSPTTDATKSLGHFNERFTEGYFSGSIQGAQPKALTNNVATAFAILFIPQTAGANYAGGKLGYTIFCKNATNQATQSGTVTFACHNLAGTESCGFGTPDGVTLGDGTASLAAPVFTSSAGADLVTINVQSNCTGITPTTHTIEHRPDMLHPNTYTPIL